MNNSETRTIRYIEELSLNAWPSYKIELYDGWLIRYSANYTYRTNSVEQIGASTISIEDKISYCEDIYRGFGTDCCFKINPLIDPSFDRLLSDKGYNIRHVTEVMTADLSRVHLMTPVASEYEFENRLGLPSCVHYGSGDDSRIGAGPSVVLTPFVTSEWVNGLFHLNGTTDPVLRRIVPSMYNAIPKNTICASVEIDGRMVASGLGIVDRDYIGIYAIYVSPSCRRRHYAQAVVSTLLREGKAQGASHAYLQVVQGNMPAKSLYLSLGFQDLYTYWFRCRHTLDTHRVPQELKV